jgi:hypothetical protein
MRSNIYRWLAGAGAMLIAVQPGCGAEDELTAPPPPATTQPPESLPDGLAAAAGELTSGHFRVRGALGQAMGANPPAMQSGRFRLVPARRSAF